MNDFTVNPTDKIKELEQERDELKAHVERLNEAFYDWDNFVDDKYEFVLVDVFNATPAQSLKEIKADAIEDAIIYANNRIEEEGWAHGAMIEIKFLMEYVEQLRTGKSAPLDISSFNSQTILLNRCEGKNKHNPRPSLEVVIKELSRHVHSHIDHDGSTTASVRIWSIRRALEYLLKYAKQLEE